ncbi:MAG: M64 family metallopeptidase, partial [Acidobacteriota bacterium]
PDNLKWKDLMEDGTPIPTPWEKDAFDTMDTAWQKERAGMNDRIAELKKTGAAADKIREAEEEYASRDREHSDKVDAYLEASRWRGKVGAYEGAGYSAEGLYRPMVDCIMFSKGSKPFCKVCEAAIRRVIQCYLEQR